MERQRCGIGPRILAALASALLSMPVATVAADGGPDQIQPTVSLEEQLAERVAEPARKSSQPRVAALGRRAAVPRLFRELDR